MFLYNFVNNAFNTCTMETAVSPATVRDDAAYKLALMWENGAHGSSSTNGLSPGRGNDLEISSVRYQEKGIVSSFSHLVV